jgi:hypothetical protein
MITERQWFRDEIDYSTGELIWILVVELVTWQLNLVILSPWLCDESNRR